MTRGGKKFSTTLLKFEKKEKKKQFRFFHEKYLFILNKFKQLVII